MFKPKKGISIFFTFIDGYSRYRYIYLVSQKFKNFMKFLKYKAKVEKQLGVHINELQSNRGSKYMSGDFKFYLTQEWIVAYMSAPRTPQQNSVAERRNRTLHDMVKSILSYSSPHISFWTYTLKTIVYLLNLVPSSSVSKTPT